MNQESAELADWVGHVLGEHALGEHALGEKIALAPLPAEASTRRFFRVTTTASTFVAMHSPPDTEDNPRYVRLTKLFRRHRLSTPAVHAADFDRGFLLLEDLGERDFAAAYAAGEIDAPLEAAVRTLATLQSVVSQDIPPYTVARFADELAIFTDWLLGRFLDLDVPPRFAAVRDALIEATRSVPQCTVHRDYHCRNLLWRDDGSVGIVDFQDALVGPCCYDIASLLRDCYVEFDETLVAKWRARFFALAELDCTEPVFNRAFDLVAIQRQLKAAGIFARLYLDRGHAGHLRDIVPVLRRIAWLGHRHAETRELADWLDKVALPRAAERRPGPP